MSETSSDSPSVHIHPISPSSSLSSNNSEPHSEPTSDEQPDLGAFNAVLREWTHLQPPPRIPVQIRSATSSTTPTFQPSLTGSELRSERSRNTRVSGISAISSFTRPPSSSAHPEGSTVWAHAPIASYLYSGTPTPSNDDDDNDGESYEIEGEYTPNSMASTSLTVEIESETDFDESNGRVESSPYPFPSESGISGVSMPVPLQTEVIRVDSREPEHLEDEPETSETSRDRTYTITAIRSSGDTESESRLTSMQLQSQVRPTPTTASLSSATAAPSGSSLVSHSSPVYPQNRSRNPLPPRTTSDSSYTTSGSASSSDFSLISYQISETPSMPVVEESSSANVSADSSSGASASVSMGLKTQRSMPTSSSESTVSLGTQRPQQTLQQTLQQQSHLQVLSSDASTMSSSGSPLPNPHPLPNPYSPLSIPASVPPVSPSNNRRSMLANVWRQDIIVDDLGTPDQPPSETLLFNPLRERKPEFHPIIDDDEEDIKVERIVLHERNDSTMLQSASSAGYAAGYDRPGPSTSTQGNTYSQAHGHSQGMDRHEPHNEDDDEFDLEEDERYRSRYPFSHGPAPRSFGPALTPKGLPFSSIDSRPQAPTQLTTNNMTTNSLVQHFGYSNQSLLQTSQQSQSQQPEQFLPMQASIVQPQFQYQYQTNQLNSASYTTATTSMPQSTSQPSLPPSYPYTPRAAIPTQSSNAYISQPTYSSSTSQYSYPQNQAQAHTEPATNPHGYPYSLLGLHALPATFDPPEVDELPSTSSSNIAARATTSQIPPRAQTHRRAPSDPYNASFSDDNSTVRGVEPTSHLEPEMESILLEQAVPSLGVLDGVLSFIAVERERARNIATREASSTADVEDSRDTGSGDDGEAEAAEGETVEGEEDWKHIVENEPNQPKRKRRRKRPPRSHAAAAAQALIATGGPEAPVLPPNTTGLEGAGAVDLPVSILAAVTASPKRKKKTKSTPASASASTSSSLLSVPLNGDGLLTPTPNKEFLVPPPSLSRSASKNRDKPAFTGLRRPDELLIRSNIPSDDDSDFDGGRTPTNFDVLRAEASHGTEVAVLPINLNGKKGKRVGRREREREKARHDAINAEQELKGGDSMDVAVEENSFEFDFDDDDNDDDGLEPRDEDEEQGEDNDSLSNLSLLKPPRRRRDRSRRRKGRDTTYIHTVTGINGAYKSTPGTPGGHLHPYAIANDGDQFSPDVEIKQSSVEDDDAFEPKINTTPEKRKRTRTKRLKPARSFPDMNVDTLAGGSTAPALAPVPIVEDRTQLAVMKATKGRVRAAELLGSHDVLDMDRNQLQKYLIASGSGIILMNSPPEPKNQPPPDSKRGRLLALARQLRELFPEQYDDLGRIIQRIEKAGATQGKAKKTVSSDAKEDIDTHPGTSRPISIPGSKRKRSRKGGHARTGSESGTTGGDGFDHDDEQLDDPQNADGGAGHVLDIEEEEEEIDPRGRPPKRSDALVHVFIDHSNILIGLLSHLKRHQAYRKNALNKARSRPLPALISKATAATRASNQTDPASAFAAVKASSSRPLPVPSNGETNTTSASQTTAVPLEANPIPLPSFATMTRSLPTTSALSAYMAARNNGEHSDDATGQLEREANSDGYEYPTRTNADKDESGAGDDSVSVEPTKNGKEKKVPRHLWHAALALILERGRPVTRRVVVTSSPLYQPMDAIERLGYELRVFIRVPDLGDGQDRERYRDKDKLASGKSSGSAKSTQSSPATTTSSSGLPLLSRKSKSIGHVRQASGNTSTESGSGGGAGGSGNASGGNLHPYYGITNSASQTRVKFREQGVDELLQLKLHQAIAATDDVPEGSTIVLATGDGNMGQFNEDGFLGPVRTALRRGWKVELYAWEDGLSRAWKREFGAGSEWGRRDLFRVIAMEQFAHVLVEAVEHMSN